jgi:hypothetical protein
MLLTQVKPSESRGVLYYDAAHQTFIADSSNQLFDGCRLRQPKRHA